MERKINAVIKTTTATGAYTEEILIDGDPNCNHCWHIWGTTWGVNYSEKTEYCCHCNRRVRTINRCALTDATYQGIQHGPYLKE